MAPPARRRGSDGATWLRTFAERSIAWATVAAASYQGSLQGVVDTPSSPQLCVSPNAVRTSSPVASRIVIPSRSPYTGPTRARRLPSGRRHLARGQRCDGPAPSGVSALRGECEHHSRAGFAPDRRLGRSLGDLLPARPASVPRNLAGDVVSPDVCRLHWGFPCRGSTRSGTLGDRDGLRRARSILLGHLALTIPSSRRGPSPAWPLPRRWRQLGAGPDRPWPRRVSVRGDAPESPGRVRRCRLGPGSCGSTRMPRVIETYRWGARPHAVVQGGRSDTCPAYTLSLPCRTQEGYTR